MGKHSRGTGSAGNGKKIKYLISVDCIVDGALQLVRRRVDDVQPLPDVLAALFTVVLVWPGPTHPGLDVDAGAVFQEKLHRILVTEKTNKREIFICEANDEILV